MFFQQAFKGVNDLWRYIIVTIVVFIGYQIGTIPLMLALWRSVDQNPNLDNNDIQAFMAEPDFSKFGINTNLGLTLMLLLFVAALAVFYFIFTPIHRRGFKSLTTTSSKLDWSKILFAFFVWMGLSLFAEGINYAMSPGDYSLNFKWNTFIPLVLLCIFILPLQTSFEELFFRGYMMQGIGTSKVQKVIGISLGLLVTYVTYQFIGTQLTDFFYTSFGLDGISQGEIYSTLLTNTVFLLMALCLCTIGGKIGDQLSKGGRHRNYKFVPLIITSILFGLIHSANPEVEKFGFGTMQIYYISAGLMLGIMTVMDDGLELALGTHAATNFTGAVFIGYDGAAINTDSLFKSHALNAEVMTYGFIVLAVIFLIILKYKYKWTSFAKIFEPIDKPNEDSNIDQFVIPPKVV